MKALHRQKTLEVEQFVRTTDLEVIEVHPEVYFARMNGVQSRRARPVRPKPRLAEFSCQPRDHPVRGPRPRRDERRRRRYPRRRSHSGVRRALCRPAGQLPARPTSCYMCCRARLRLGHRCCPVRTAPLCLVRLATAALLGFSFLVKQLLLAPDVRHSFIRFDPRFDLVVHVE